MRVSSGSPNRNQLAIFALALFERHDLTIELPVGPGGELHQFAPCKPAIRDANCPDCILQQVSAVRRGSRRCGVFISDCTLAHLHRPQQDIAAHKNVMAREEIIRRDNGCDGHRSTNF
jgi:hypothetical protein